MDNDSLVGSAKHINGAVKHVVGKAVGDAKLESNRKADKSGGLKDTLKGKQASRRRASFLAIVDLTPGRRERSILLRHPAVSAPKLRATKRHLRGRAVPPSSTANDVQTQLVR